MCSVAAHFLNTSIPELLKMPSKEIYHWYEEALNLNKKLNG